MHGHLHSHENPSPVDISFLPSLHPPVEILHRIVPWAVRGSPEDAGASALDELDYLGVKMNGRPVHHDDVVRLWERIKMGNVDLSHEPYELFRVRPARIRVPPGTQYLVTENAVYAHQRNRVMSPPRNECLPVLRPPSPPKSLIPLILRVASCLLTPIYLVREHEQVFFSFSAFLFFRRQAAGLCPVPIGKVSGEICTRTVGGGGEFAQLF